MNQIEFKALLSLYDDAYYNNDDSLISDCEYDNLKEEYIKLYGEYNYVPGNASNKFEKYEHSTYVSSLGKKQITDKEGIKKELERLWPVVIQEKADGLTLVTYPDGKQVTRGNGRIGEIVTKNVEKVEGLGTPFSAYPVRSEIVMLHSEFERINKERIKNNLKPYENCRNAAAGMIRNLDSSKVEGLKVLSYNLLFDDEVDDGEENENASAQTQINYLKLNNWNTVNSYEPKDIDDAINYIENYDRTKLDYDIDGLVIKHNGNKKFGITEHHPLNAIAIKFVPEGQWTTIENIEWSVGRTGKVTPIANLTPINIMKSTIKKATLHNYGIMQVLDLTKICKEGNKFMSEVYVIKANDVIPAITKVKHLKNDKTKIIPINKPTKCPCCQSDLVEENDQLYCKNDSCESKIINRLIHLSQRDAFNIENLGEETCEKLVNKYKMILNQTLSQIMNSEEIMQEDDEDYEDEYELVCNELKNIHPSFIYKLTKKDILSIDGFADKSATKLYENIQASLNITFDKFLFGCGIPLVGKKTARDIAEFYYSKDKTELENFVDDYYTGFKRLIKAKGIGTETVLSLTEKYETYIIPFGNYFNIKDYIPKKKAVNQLTFVITGEFDIPRTEIKDKIEKAGHKVTGSVSSKTNYVLVGENPGEKQKQAVEKNVIILDSLEKLEEIIK